MALTQKQVSELYVAIFNRASEGEGNKFWQTSQTGAAAANDMLATTDAKAYFGTSLDSNQAFIEHIYSNTLNKTYAQDKGGIDFWVNALNSGMSRGEVVASLVTAVADYSSSTDPVTKAAYDQFNNRVEVSNYMANTVEKAPANYATSTKFATTGTTGLVVTNSASTVTAAKTSVDTMKPVPGQTFTLTTGIDDLKGTDNADLFKAVNSSAIAEGTLQGGDKIDGGAGNDTLKVDMNKAWEGFTTGSMTNVENVNITSKTATTVNYDASGSTGVSKYVIDSTTGSVTLSQLDALANLEVTGPQADSTFKAAYKATSTVATGTQTDVQNLKVTNVGTINTAAANVASNAKVMTVDIDKVETLAITTAGTANSLDLSTSADVKTVTVAGEGQTEIKAVGTATTSFDASASTGNVIANLTAAATGALTSVKTGAGNDKVTVALDDLSTTATIAGGAGTDTLVVASTGAKTLQSTMSGFESIEFENAGNVTGDVTLSGTNVTDLTSVNVKAGTLAGDINFVNMGANAFTVNTTGVVAGKTISTDNTGATTVNLNKSAAATTSEAVTTNVKTAGATTINVGEYVQAKNVITTTTTGAVTLNVASKVVNNAETTGFIALAAGTDGKLVADSASSVTVTADGELTNANIQAAKATTVTIKAGATKAASIDQLVASKATTLNLEVGSKGLDMETGAAGPRDTDLSLVQTITATNSGHLDFTGVALEDVANATFTGSGNDAKLTLTTVGDANVTYNQNLTITGQKAGLAVDDINAGTGSATVNISGVTGNATLASINGNAGVTLNAKDLKGTLAIANTENISASKGNISIDVSNMEKAATVSYTSAASLGAIYASTASGAAGTLGGDVTVLATNAIAGASFGILTGKNVSVDATNALATVVIGNGAVANTDIFAQDSVTYKGAVLSTLTNAADIKATDGSTALTVNLTGGAATDTYTITGNAKQTGITVAGNLGAGANSVTVDMLSNTLSSDQTTAQTVNLSGVTGSSKSATTTSTTLRDTDSNITYTGSAVKDTITLVASSDKIITITDSVIDTVVGEKDALVIAGAAGAVTYKNLSVSGVELLTVNTNAASVNASAFSDKTIAATLTTALTLTGTTGNDVIDLNKFTHSAVAANLVINADAGNDTIIGTAGTETINGGTGTDTLTGGLGADIFQFAAGDSGAAMGNKDIITDFVAGTDKLQFTGITDVVSAQQAAVQTAVTALAAGATDAQIATAMATANTTDLGVSFAVFNGNTYVYAEASGAATGVPANDVFIQLSGVTTAPTFGADVTA